MMLAGGGKGGGRGQEAEGELVKVEEEVMEEGGGRRGGLVRRKRVRMSMCLGPEWRGKRSVKVQGVWAGGWDQRALEVRSETRKEWRGRRRWLSLLTHH